MLVDNTHIYSVLHGAVSSCIAKTEMVVNMVGAYFEPESPEKERLKETREPSGYVPHMSFLVKAYQL